MYGLLSCSVMCHVILTHCGLVVPYGDTDMKKTLAQVMA